MHPTMRAKMKITNVANSETSERLTFAAVYKDGAYPADGSDEDNTFARWTPSADLNMTITNPDLHGKFAVGDTFYVDFTPVSAKDAAPAPQAAQATTDTTIEQEIQAKGLTAPRVTPADIESNIVDARYFTAWEGAQLAYWGDSDPAVPKPIEGEPDKNGPLSLLTFCVLVLRNGFTVTGESACASPENFDAEVGQKVARANAVQKIWPLMGYALKERLHTANGQ